MLIWTDATTTKIYELKRGRDHRFGTRDDVMKRQFAASNFTDPRGRRLTDPNGVYFDRKTGHLFTVRSKQHLVLETTLAGAFVKTIAMPFCRTALNGCHGFSDLVFALGTDGRGGGSTSPTGGSTTTSTLPRTTAGCIRSRLVDVP